MSVFRAFFIAISMYSRIPVPQFAWKDKDMRYTICFFPFIGVILGLFQYLLNCLLLKDILCDWEFVLLSMLLPLLITGGIHLDGFMDTADALHSYAPSDRKLAIMKDPHIGAFSVISLLSPALLWILSLMELSAHMTASISLLFSAVYILSRILSGLALVCFPSAKKDGLLFTFASASHKKNVRIILVLYAVVLFLLMLLTDPAAGGLLLLFAVLFTVFYYRMSMHQLGGITGDTEGWFLCITELFMFMILALYMRF